MEKKIEYTINIDLDKIKQEAKEHLKDAKLPSWLTPESAEELQTKALVRLEEIEQGLVHVFRDLGNGAELYEKNYTVGYVIYAPHINEGDPLNITLYRFDAARRWQTKILPIEVTALCSQLKKHKDLKKLNLGVIPTDKIGEAQRDILNGLKGVGLLPHLKTKDNNYIGLEVPMYGTIFKVTGDTNGANVITVRQERDCIYVFMFEVDLEERKIIRMEQTILTPMLMEWLATYYNTQVELLKERKALIEKEKKEVTIDETIAQLEKQILTLKEEKEKLNKEKSKS